MPSAAKICIRSYSKNPNEGPGGGIMDEKEVVNPLVCEISTHWLGVENPGMNVAIYTPYYHAPNCKMLMCVSPGGRFEITAAEEENVQEVSHLR